jgi:hypothetical protein
MKDFLKKVFFFDHPAQGVFAGFTLLLAAIWIVPALIFIKGDFPRFTVFNQICLAGLLIAVIFVLIVWIRFYFCHPQPKKVPWNAPGRLVLYAVGLLSVLLSGWIFLYFLRSGGSEEFSLAGAAVLVFLIWVLWVPLFLFPGNWKIILVRGVCLSASIGCILFAANILRVLLSEYLFLINLADDYFPAEFTNYALLYPAAFGSVLLWILSYLLTARMYAELAQIPIRKIFCRATVTILCLWAGVYLISLGMAYAARSRTDRTMAELEKHFGQKLSLDALYAAYSRNRLVDEKFWQQVKSCIEQVYPEKAISLEEWIADVPDGFYPESTLRQFRPVFERSEARKKLAQMMNRRLPAKKWTILSGGDPTCLAFFELNWCRTVCRWELWKVRFALADGKLPDAYAAMERMKRVTDYLGNRTCSLLTTLVMVSCERYRMRGFELLLASGKVPDEVLNRWKAELEQDEKAVPGIHFDTVYAEAVFLANWTNSLAYGRTPPPKTDDSPRNSDFHLPGKKSPGIYGLRYLYPPLWYYCTLDCSHMMRLFKVRNFGDIVFKKEMPGFLCHHLLPPTQSAELKIAVLTAWYHAMQALIGVELEKRRTGKYPDALKNPPIDPFTGKTMIYRKGMLTLNDPVWIGGTEKFDSKAKRQVPGVEIVSAGPNRKNDIGARLIFKKATAIDGPDGRDGPDGQKRGKQSGERNAK